jgi:hypothetical protein
MSTTLTTLTNHHPAKAFTYFSATGGGGTLTEARSHMSRPLIMSYAVLALIYCINNQVGTPSCYFPDLHSCHPSCLPAALLATSRPNLA